MTIYVSCHFCNFSFEVDGKHAGHNIKCPECSGLVSVPSGLDFVEEQTTNCPVCGSSIDKEEEICPECSSNIKSKEILAVERLPEAIKRPQNTAPANSLIKSLVVFVLFLAMGSGIFFYFQKKRHFSIPAVDLLPAASRELVFFDFEKIAAIAGKSKSKEQDFAKYIQGKLVYKFNQLFPERLKISAAQDVKQVYLTGENEYFLGLNEEAFCGLLVAKGNFDAEVFDEYARILTLNSGLQKKYQGYTILTTQALIAQKRQQWLFTLLDEKTLVGASDITLVKKVIELNLGKGQALSKKFGEGILDQPALWKFYGAFTDDFFQSSAWLKKIDQKHRYLLDAKNISFCLDIKEKKFTLRLNVCFYKRHPVLIAQKLRKYISTQAQDIDSLRERLPQILPMSRVAFSTIIADLKDGVKGEKGGLSVLWTAQGKRCENLLTFVDWRLRQGNLLLRASRDWGKIEQMHVGRDAKTREQVTKFLQLYSATPFSQKAKDLLHSMQQQASEQQLENQANIYYRNLMAGMTLENEVSYWPKLASFPAQYANTTWGQTARNKRQAIVKNVLAAINGNNESLVIIVKKHRFSDLASLAKNVEGLLVNKRIFDAMRNDAPQLGKLLQSLIFQLEIAQKAKQKYIAQNQELYRQLSEDCSDFMATEFPKMIAARKFDELESQLREFEQERQKIDVPKKQAQEIIDQGKTEARAIRNLFLLVNKEFRNNKKKGKRIKLLVIGKNGSESLNGKIKKIAKDGFTIKSNGKYRKFPYESLTSRSLSKYMRRKDRRKPKVAYYLGLLYFYEGQKKEYVLGALKVIKMGEYRKRAQLLQQKLENQ